MKRYIITALCAFVSYCAWGQLNAPCFMIDAPSNAPALYNTEQLSITNDSTVIDLENSPIYALSVTGQVQLLSSANSMARIILVDNYGTEYLVYEINSLLTDTTTVNFERVGRETLWQDMVYASHLVVRLTNATITMDIPSLITQVQEQSAPTLKRARAIAQNDTIINVLNRNLIARDIPWRAGRTDIADLEYSEKKILLGENNPLHNIEYYVGGYYIDPAVEAELNNPVSYTSGSIEDLVDDMMEMLKYPREFNWRNRHGKDWTTLAKSQSPCGTCWIFSAVAAVESYTNLYYNKSLNLNLSEQELRSCITNHSCNSGGYIYEALNYIKQNGIIGEADFVHRADTIGVECDLKPSNPQTHIQIENYTIHYLKDEKMPMSKLRSLLIRQPVAVAIDKWQHAILFTGYKILTSNEFTTVVNNNGSYSEIFVDVRYENHTAWTVKNSMGYFWGEHGYGNIIVSSALLNHCTTINGKITSKEHSDSDIICSDADNDGYYFWGIGEKPAHCPVWASDIPDGDDSDPMYAAMNDYGHLDSIGPAFKEPMIINTNTTWSAPQVVPSNLIIPSGVTLTLTSYLTMHPDAQILIQGGRLIIDGGTVRNGYIRNKGSLIIKDGGIVEMSGDDRYEHNPQDIQVIDNGNAPFDISSNLQEGGFKHVSK